MKTRYIVIGVVAIAAAVLVVRAVKRRQAAKTSKQSTSSTALDPNSFAYIGGGLPKVNY